MVKIGFINTILSEGNIVTLYGPPGAGKTNCAVSFIEKAVELGYDVWTTIHFFKYDQVAQACEMGRLPKGIRYRKLPPEVHTVKSLSELLLGLLSGGKNIVMVDEAGIFASSTAPMSRKVRELKELCYVIRHLNSSMMLITQAKGSIAPDLRSTLVTYELRIKKITKNYRTLTVKKSKPVINEEGEEVVRFEKIGPTIGKIPLTRYPWDGFFIPKFEFDIKLDDAFNKLGEYNSIEVLDHGHEVIEKLLDEKEKKSKTSHDDRAVARESVRNEYLTMEDSGKFKKRADIFAKIANNHQKTYNWVYQICRDLPFDKNKYNPS